MQCQVFQDALEDAVGITQSDINLAEILNTLV